MLLCFSTILSLIAISRRVWKGKALLHSWFVSFRSPHELCRRGYIEVDDHLLLPISTLWATQRSGTSGPRGRASGPLCERSRPGCHGHPYSSGPWFCEGRVGQQGIGRPPLVTRSPILSPRRRDACARALVRPPTPGRNPRQRPDCQARKGTGIDHTSRLQCKERLSLPFSWKRQDAFYYDGVCP